MPQTPNSVFETAVKKGASDVHIIVGYPIMFRMDGELEPQAKTALTKAQVTAFVKGITSPASFKRLENDLELDISYALKSGARMRINCHYERGSLSLVARIIPTDIPDLETLGFTDGAMELCNLQNGIILFTGPTGTGKSTSMAAMLDYINQNRASNIMTLEDPIEFLFPKGKGVIRQRQMGDDFHHFGDAMRSVLRQDPDIVMVGEMRDLETISAALTLAETGHLIFATLHTPNAIQSVSRLVDVFPPHQQQQIRTQLSLSLRAVVAQKLIPHADGGRCAHREVLINTPAVANIIRENRIQELTSVLQTGRDNGMCSFEQDAKRLYKEELISAETYDWLVE